MCDENAVVCIAGEFYRLILDEEAYTDVKFTFSSFIFSLI